MFTSIDLQQRYTIEGIRCLESALLLAPAFLLSIFLSKSLIMCFSFIELIRADTTGKIFVPSDQQISRFANPYTHLPFTWSKVLDKPSMCLPLALSIMVSSIQSV